MMAASFEEAPSEFFFVAEEAEAKTEVGAKVKTGVVAKTGMEIGVGTKTGPGPSPIHYSHISKEAI
jgi:hypothetical protein